MVCLDVKAHTAACVAQKNTVGTVWVASKPRGQKELTNTAVPKCWPF